jgi:hypothetical protein
MKTLNVKPNQIVVMMVDGIVFAFKAAKANRAKSLGCAVIRVYDSVDIVVPDHITIAGVFSAWQTPSDILKSLGLPHENNRETAVYKLLEKTLGVGSAATDKDHYMAGLKRHEKTAGKACLTASFDLLSSMMVEARLQQMHKANAMTKLLEDASGKMAGRIALLTDLVSSERRAEPPKGWATRVREIQAAQKTQETAKAAAAAAIAAAELGGEKVGFDKAAVKAGFKEVLPTIAEQSGEVADLKTAVEEQAEELLSRIVTGEFNSAGISMVKAARAAVFEVLNQLDTTETSNRPEATLAISKLSDDLVTIKSDLSAMA